MTGKRGGPMLLAEPSIAWTQVDRRAQFTRRGPGLRSGPGDGPYFSSLLAQRRASAASFSRPPDLVLAETSSPIHPPEDPGQPRKSVVGLVGLVANCNRSRLREPLGPVTPKL